MTAIMQYVSFVVVTAADAAPDTRSDTVRSFVRCALARSANLDFFI